MVMKTVLALITRSVMTIYNFSRITVSGSDMACIILLHVFNLDKSTRTIDFIFVDNQKNVQFFNIFV